MKPNTEIYVFQYTSPIGDLLMSSDGEHITGLWLENQKYYGAGLPDEYTEKSLPLFEEAASWLDLYFTGEKLEFKVPLAPAGTPFQKMVWEILCQIPVGQVMTYGEIAKAVAGKLGRATMSAQAVGSAVGHNPISILIPCHRVVGSDGSLTGYAGGIDRKVKLLELEHVDMKLFYRPKRGTAL